jgi:hypothetical protein
MTRLARKVAGNSWGSAAQATSGNWSHLPTTTGQTEATNTSLNLKREQGPASQKGLDLPSLTQRESLDSRKLIPCIATIRPLSDSASATPASSTHLADGRHGATCENYSRRRRIEKARGRMPKMRYLKVHSSGPKHQKVGLSRRSSQIVHRSRVLRPDDKY